ncbi:hypothetical protein OGAPHI_007308 [Ogataea philodendri]|uniref:Uncharacterized protein n=1 Tax=Ogataea philodendri TaxID=1378263 RepID=A0A9P8NUH8_9ASCO|nr:uncharacterized protein OGAPHI_007308 [Ogataea philodendri]KAH3660103.1 hypothetical protein OGAPHI_007308 [Ogataea philodendri]
MGHTKSMEFPCRSHTIYLSREGERQTELVSRLAKLEGVESTSKTQGDARSKLLGVSQSQDTGVGKLSLDERGAVQAVLGGNLNGDWVGAGSRLGVESTLGSDLELRGNLVVVTGSENGKVASGSQGNSVRWSLVTNSSRVAGQSGGLNVVGQRSTGGEAVLADGQVTVEDWALEQVNESTGVDGLLSKVQVQLGGSVSTRNSTGDQFRLETWRQSVNKLNLSVQGVGSVPALGQCQTGALVCVFTFQRSRGLSTGSLTLGGESDTVWSDGLKVQCHWGEVVEVLSEDIVGWFSNVRECWWGHFVKVG